MDCWPPVEAIAIASWEREFSTSPILFIERAWALKKKEMSSWFFFGFSPTISSVIFSYIILTFLQIQSIFFPMASGPEPESFRQKLRKKRGLALRSFKKQTWVRLASMRKSNDSSSVLEMVSLLSLGHGWKSCGERALNQFWLGQQLGCVNEHVRVQGHNMKIPCLEL